MRELVLEEVSMVAGGNPGDDGPSDVIVIRANARDAVGPGDDAWTGFSAIGGALSALHPGLGAGVAMIGAGISHNVNRQKDAAEAAALVDACNSGNDAACDYIDEYMGWN